MRRPIIFKHNKTLEEIALWLLPYHWAYKKGVTDGYKKTNYYKGYADGQKDGMEYVIESHRKFFDKKDYRKTGKESSTK
jgi:hypothetical protein